MTHGEIREKILQDHAVLRGCLNEIESLVSSFEKGGAEVGEELRELGVSMFETFASHLIFEDNQFVPILRTIPETGESLAISLTLEHREQRELLKYLIRRLCEENRPTTLIARELSSFANYLHQDMHYEESTLLRICKLEP